MFQSTHPHGVRHNHVLGEYQGPSVSIHAPTRGATQNSAILWSLRGCFNPRTHTGCDYENFFTPVATSRFNPRTHTGCDRTAPLNTAAFARFNPRTHTGCD